MPRSSVVIVAACLVISACVHLTDNPPQTIEAMTISARPGAPTASVSAGFTALGLDAARDGFLYVPPSYNPATPMPLVVLLHGGGHSSDEWKAQQAIFDDVGVLVVAPDSRSGSWDLPLSGRYGPDVTFIDAALAKAFTMVNVDAARVGIGGFSDGASEALGIGIANGDLFSTVIAFSPGELFGPYRRGEPKFFVSHGTEDMVIPFSRSNTQIVPALQVVFPTVNFVTFTGGHVIPNDIAIQAYTMLRDG